MNTKPYPVVETADEVRVSFRGRLDTASQDAMDEAIRAAMTTDGPRIVLDFRDVEYLCSACIRPILRACRSLNEMSEGMEIVNPSEPVRKVLQMVGLGDMMPIGEGALRILDFFRRKTSCNEQVVQNVRRFLEESLATFGWKARRIQEFVDEFLYICEEGLDPTDVEGRLRCLFAELDFKTDFAASLTADPKLVLQTFSPFFPSQGTMLFVAADERISEQIIAMDTGIATTVMKNTPATEFENHSGTPRFAVSFLAFSLQNSENPEDALHRIAGVTEQRIVVLETVYLNEANRRFNLFLNWFRLRILEDLPWKPARLNTPEGWERTFAKAGLSVLQNIELGLDQPNLPEYHWLYILEIARTASQIRDN